MMINTPSAQKTELHVCKIREWPFTFHSRVLTLRSLLVKACEGSVPRLCSFSLSLSIISQVAVRMSCDLSGSEVASEGEEFCSRLFDIAGCDSSATEEDGDYKPRQSRKRGCAPVGAVAGKRVKKEAITAEDYDTAASMGLTETDAVNLSQASPPTNFPSHFTHPLLSSKPFLHCLQPQHGRNLVNERSVAPEMELLGGGSCMGGITEQAEKCSSAAETTDGTAGTAA